MSFLTGLIISGIVFLFVLGHAQGQSIRSLPALPCDFYGQETIPQTLAQGSIISARDPQGIVIGQCAITTAGRYGFLTASSDDPATVQDEGGQDNDVITFYINGVIQQKQAVFKSGQTIAVDLGQAREAGTFTKHLDSMPGYVSYDNNPDYSGVAVADMILDFLNPGNTDTQQTLMSYADKNSDRQTQCSELEKLLNDKAPSVYNFGSTLTLQQYSQRGIIDSFSAANQNDCIKQICHWLSYKVRNAVQGKEFVPVAVSTSANPATNADSGYQQWMSLVGVRTNQDPFPALSDNASFREVYRAPETLEFFGVFLNDPSQSGLGFHTYVSADVWLNTYFRPIKSGVEGEGRYIAIMEPPDSAAQEVKAVPAQENPELKLVLEIPQKGVSIFIPHWMAEDTQNYLTEIFNKLKDCADFISLAQDAYFSRGLTDVTVRRCYKVDGANDDYTIIPFEKTVNGDMVTVAAAIVNNTTGQLNLAAVEPDASTIYTPMSIVDSYRALRSHVGWGEWSYPVGYWLSSSQGGPLYPGWNTAMARVEKHGDAITVTTEVYCVSAQNQLSIAHTSPQVQIEDVRASGKKLNCVKYVVFSAPEGAKVSIDQSEHCKGKRVFNNGNNKWMVIIRGAAAANCRISVKISDSSDNGGVTYIYLGTITSQM